MRSTKNRILVIGGILTLLTAMALHQEATSSQSTVSRADQVKSVSSLPAAVASPSSAVTFSTASLAANKSLFAYVPKPANFAQIENAYVAPSRDIHYVHVDQIASGEHSPLSRVGGRVEVTLPDGTLLPIVMESTEAFGSSRFVSEGVIDGDRGHASFAYNDGELSATIDLNEGASWQLRALGNSVAQVFPVDPALVPTCGNSSESVATSGVAAAGGLTETTAEGEEAAGDIPTSGGALAPVVTASLATKSTVRILVPYSLAITKTVSSAAVISAIDLAIANLNTDLARSAVPVKVVLAGTPGLNYTQDGKDPSSSAISNALTRITAINDGVLDGIHATRYDDKADLVCFTINQVDSSNSGIGYLLQTPNSSFNCTYGFSAISFSYLNSARTFSHEIGHNLGCDHDRAHANNTSGVPAKGTYAYSYGYTFFGKNGAEYRTIMAYPPGQVIAYFSNPNLAAPSPLSVLVGSAVGSSTQAYNALTITQNAPEVSSYHVNRLVVRAAALTRGK